MGNHSISENTPVAIRRALEKDYAGFNLLFKQGDEYHASKAPDRFRPPLEPAREQSYFLSLLKDPTVGVFIAELNCELVGVLIVQVHDPIPPTHRPNRFVHVDSLVVREGYRRRGIGKALMAQADTWTLEQGAIEMDLNVHAFNTDAISLYEKMGYQIVIHRMWKKMK